MQIVTQTKNSLTQDQISWFYLLMSVQINVLDQLTNTEINHENLLFLNRKFLPTKTLMVGKNFGFKKVFMIYFSALAKVTFCIFTSNYYVNWLQHRRPDVTMQQSNRIYWVETQYSPQRSLRDIQPLHCTTAPIDSVA